MIKAPRRSRSLDRSPREGDHHDLGGGMKSVRTAPPTRVFSGVSTSSTAAGLSLVVPGLLPDLSGTLRNTGGAADHEQRGQRPRGELAEQHDRREDRDDLVADQTASIFQMIGSSRAGWMPTA